MDRLAYLKIGAGFLELRANGFHFVHCCRKKERVRNEMQKKEFCIAENRLSLCSPQEQIKVSLVNIATKGCILGSCSFSIGDDYESFIFSFSLDLGGVSK